MSLRRKKLIISPNDIFPKNRQTKGAIHQRLDKNQRMNLLLEQKNTMLNEISTQHIKLMKRKEQDWLPDLFTTKQLSTNIHEKFDKKINSKSTKNTMLLNEIISILKNEDSTSCLPSKLRRKNSMKRTIMTQPTQFNQFIPISKSSNPRLHKPRIIDSQIMRVAGDKNIVRRKLYSEEKRYRKDQIVKKASTIHQSDILNAEITFYNNFPKQKILNIRTEQSTEYD